MAKQSFESKSDQDKVFWLNNFSVKLVKYAAKYALTADDVKDMIASAAYFQYWVNYLTQTVDYSKKVTTYKNQVRSGVPAGAAAPVQPSAPDPGDIPVTVAPGAFKRAFSLAQRIKKNKDYTTGDGDDLGIEGPVVILPDLPNVKPVIKIITGNGGHPTILWTKGKMDGIDIYVDRGTGMWALLTTDNFPDFTDETPLPAPGQIANWKYRCIYRYNDKVVGQWSDDATIAVKG